MRERRRRKRKISEMIFGEKISSLQRSLGLYEKVKSKFNTDFADYRAVFIFVNWNTQNCNFESIKFLVLNLAKNYSNDMVVLRSTHILFIK